MLWLSHAMSDLSYAMSELGYVRPESALFKLFHDRCKLYWFLSFFTLDSSYAMVQLYLI